MASRRPWLHAGPRSLSLLCPGQHEQGRLAVQPPESQEPVSRAACSTQGLPGQQSHGRCLLPHTSHRLVLLNFTCLVSVSSEVTYSGAPQIRTGQGWRVFLTAILTTRCVWQGCMKSGQVLVDRRFKWFEPEYWRFGEAAASDGAINYPRHASGQIYGLSGPVAKYIRRNAPILHRYAPLSGAWANPSTAARVPGANLSSPERLGLASCKQLVSLVKVASHMV